MQQILDLHIHSKYSRACSKELTLENINATCRQKGVDIVATGDFTYPDWFDALTALTPTPLSRGARGQESGLYQLPNSDGKVKFILSTEFALIYKQGDPSHKGGASKTRRIHLVILAPNIKAVEKLNKYLDSKYNIRSDGRPILGMSAPNLCEVLFDIDEKFMIIPAHIWTPWFAVFGSKSGFDSLEECFAEYTKDIYAIETGLSSDAEMNWRLSALDNLTITSSSDAHSLPNIGREANVMDLEEVSYDEIYRIIKEKDLTKLKYTIEFYPEEGMYHYDGHRLCGVRFSPKETKKHKGICPKCKKPLTVGVNYRVDELADREVGFKPKGAVPFKKLVELDKIIAEALDIKSRSSQQVQIEYNKIIQKCGPELSVLINVPLERIAEVTLPEVVEGVKRVREGNLIVEPGFDGQYGVIKIFSEEEKKNKQASLF